jgi:Ca2+-binding EF-hand superfamily protein
MDCPEDLNGDGIVDVNDLLLIVGDWGSNDPDLDIDGDGTVDTDDLLAVIAAWGICV